MRTLVIGDIHGSAKALNQVLDRANISNEDKIIQLGDIADGWEETSECVDILLKLNKSNECVFLRGNHDVWVYDWMMTGEQPLIWTQQGGKATQDSYVNTAMLTDRNHKNFWFNQKDWYIDDQNRLFVHAGWDYNAFRSEFHSGLSALELFERQAGMSVNAGTVAKECHWDRSIIQSAAAIEVFNEKNMPDLNRDIIRALDTFKEVYIGHTASRTHLPENYHNLWNVDTGAGWHGKLTIMDIDTKEYWQSDYSKDLYPNSKGRG